ncbi:hypothetical protein DL95DRAFT_417217 [Leptodontidium sp. 2 PMI_412]|nr:hypothetical protein DL95DRAFT_417217 [Leptodontidium sp. 2 PMI_412]
MRMKTLVTTEDMSANFLKPRCLLHQEPIDPCIDYNQQQELTPGLLCVNKAVYREASSLFYAQNRFDFTMATSEDVASFLGTIGRNNADYIRRVYVNFPKFLCLELVNVTLEEGSICIFEHLERLRQFEHAHDVLI